MAKVSENGLLQGVLVAAPMLDYFTFYVRKAFAVLVEDVVYFCWLPWSHESWSNSTGLDKYLFFVKLICSTCIGEE